MLIVTNGDCAADAMRDAQLNADVLPWRDMLHDGPVPGALSLAELSRVRADFLAEPDAESRARLQRDFAGRDTRLIEASDGEIVLWFEHDLYDQLQLLQVIDIVSELDGAAGRTTIVPADNYLTYRSQAELRDDLTRRTPLSEAQIRVARGSWAAFRSDDPRNLRRLLDLDGCEVLPHLRASLLRLLQEYPDAGNGLSRTEMTILNRLNEGASGGLELFRAVQRQEEAFFLGDMPFFDRVCVLRDSTCPAIRAIGEAPTTRSAGRSHEAEGQTFELTDVGRQLRTAQVDQITLNGIDKWIGGVHLAPGNVWRWDGQSREVARDSA